MSGRVLAAVLALLLQTGLTAAARAQASDCQNLLPPGLSFPAVSSTLPYDATFSTGKSPNTSVNPVQQAFDIFSWASFVALNWPSNPDGTPMGGPITSNPTAPRVWEAYIEATGVYKENGAPPDPWGGTNTFLASIVPNYKRGQKVLLASSKNELSDIFQASFGVVAKFPWIADLNGNYVFYEIHLNKPDYDYVVCPTQPTQPQSCKASMINLYSQDGQTKFLSAVPTPAINFPQGSSSTNSYGAIEVKAAWKEIGAGDDATKFYTVQATKIDPHTDQPSTAPVPFGLVGLHIVTRTSSAPEWVWSTFEHIANAPDAPPQPPPPAGSHFNFNDPTQDQPTTGYVNKPSLPPTGQKPPEAPLTPTQITRVANNTLINDPWTQCLNSTMQAELARTVWANYRLVTTQWHSSTGFTPPVVSNTTMETYVQGQAAGISCMSCHNFAKTAGTQPNNKGPASANFSYLLTTAQPTSGARAMLRFQRK
jgi:hypothetical protein